MMFNPGTPEAWAWAAGFMTGAGVCIASTLIALTVVWLCELVRR